MRDPALLLRQLNHTCARALEEAANLCHTRAHAEVLPEHWLLKLIEQDGSDISLLLRRYDIDQHALWDNLLQALDGATHALHGKPSLSAGLTRWIQAAWLVASLQQQATRIRSWHLLVALQNDPHLVRGSAAWPLLSWSETQLERVLPELDRLSQENPDAPAAGEGSSRPQAEDDSVESAAGTTLAAPLREALERFTVNLTAKAHAGKIDPVFGRELEIRQMEDILARRRKNNPILVGDPGVGKTALVEGLALKIAAGQVSDTLKNVDILSLDMGLLQAGAGIKGEFEQRLKNVIAAIQQSPRPVLLFIDEAHTLIGAGNQSGGSDAANLLKPALARGELRTIAATTWSEYKQYFERDAALERRFQPVKVDEPDDARACRMLRGLQTHYARHHGVHIRDEAIAAAVALSRRHIPGRQLPDKAVDLLDTAAARVKMALELPPVELSRLQGQEAGLQAELAALAADLAVSNPIDQQRRQRCADELDQVQSRLAALQARVASQQDAAAALLEQRQRNDEAGMRQATQKLAEAQAGGALLSVDVDVESIARVIADWTGIPAGSLLSDELDRLLTLEERLRQCVSGQDHALAGIARQLRAAKAGLAAPDKPLGVFLLTGPSGVGKTETARALAVELCGSTDALITINLSEYQEAHTVSQLKGAPPGYVGYGQGGVLTEAVRQRPYAVILLDETEKAHRDVLNLFYQVFDRGCMRDGEGREIDFRHSVILMTSNLGGDLLLEQCQNNADISDEALLEAIRPLLLEHFQPALLARIQPLVYRGLGGRQLAHITQLKLEQLKQRIQQQFGTCFGWDASLAESIGEAGAFHDSGARFVDHLLQQQILPLLSVELLQWRKQHQQPPATAHLEFKQGAAAILLE